MQTVSRKCRRRDIKGSEDDILDALWQALPATAEVTLKNLHELGSRDMAYILISEVCDTHDGALLDSHLVAVLLIDLDGSDLESALLELLNDDGLVHFDVFYLEGCLDDVCIVTHVVFEVSVFLNGFPHAEDIILLDVPYIALIQCLNCNGFLVFHNMTFNESFNESLFSLLYECKIKHKS